MIIISQCIQICAWNLVHPNGNLWFLKWPSVVGSKDDSVPISPHVNVQLYSRNKHVKTVLAFMPNFPPHDNCMTDPDPFDKTLWFKLLESLGLHLVLSRWRIGHAWNTLTRCAIVHLNWALNCMIKPLWLKASRELSARLDWSIGLSDHSQEPGSCVLD